MEEIRTIMRQLEDAVAEQKSCLDRGNFNREYFSKEDHLENLEHDIYFLRKSTLELQSDLILTLREVEMINKKTSKLVADIKQEIELVRHETTLLRELSNNE